MNTVRVPTLAEIVIYAGGKTWMAHEFRRLRDLHGFNINSRWIDHPQVLADPSDTHPPEVHEDEEGLANIWENGCKQDTYHCDMMVLATCPQDENNQSGGLVEIGHVTAHPFNRPLYIIGTSASVEPHGTSDRAWKFQPNVYHWPEYSTGPRVEDLEQFEGFSAAVRHYRANYAPQWNERRRLDYLNEFRPERYTQSG